uniref:RE1-silencing transcription factor n=1 Tax=Cacopsylla melanoneura TaxID=428564 RepID=A0A8D8Q8Y2_9HEMI
MIGLADGVGLYTFLVSIALFSFVFYAHLYLIFFLDFHRFFFFVPELVVCQYCQCELPKVTEVLTDHCKFCKIPKRLNSRYTFVCLFCEFHTNHKNDMRNHLRIEIGDKPFSCELCPYTATKKQHLSSHMMRIHKSSVKVKVSKY